MNVMSCLLLALEKEVQQAIEPTLRFLFPGAKTASVETLQTALQLPESHELELLVMSDTNAQELELAKATMDETGLQRWVVIVIGERTPASNGSVFPLNEWRSPHLASSIKTTVLQHQLLRENTRLKGDLMAVASRVSHDLRIPLGAILNIGEMLKDIAPEPNQDVSRLVVPLLSSVEELGNLISRTSQLVRASVVTIPKQHVEMQNVVRAVLQHYERRMLKKRAAVTQPEKWPTLEAVGTWLQIIWENLLDNCLKHNADGVRIEVGWTLRADNFSFWVNDNGKGIPPEKTRSLFQPFNLLYRLDSRKGLGLSIVRRLVELQGGSCGYAPLPSGGANFFFSLPANPGT